MSDEDTTVRKFLQRDSELFHMDAEVEYLNTNDPNVTEAFN